MLGGKNTRNDTKYLVELGCNKGMLISSVWQFLYYADKHSQKFKRMAMPMSGYMGKLFKARIYEKGKTQCVLCSGRFHTEKTCGSRKFFKELFNSDPGERTFKSAIMTNMK